MNIRETWLNAITTRVSIREFEDTPLKSDHFKTLNDLVDELNAIDTEESIGLILINESNDQVYKGMIGSYGKVSSAPAFLMIIENQNHSLSKVNMGYYGEAFVLEATALGLGTCWISGTFDRKFTEDYLDLKDNERVHAIIPVGYAKPKETRKKNILSRMIGSSKRKPIEKLCNNYSDTLPQGIKDALEAARLAPSAVNGQPWRFEASDNSLKFSIEKSQDSNTTPKRLDVGISMLHAEIAFKSHNIEGHWEYLDLPEVAIYKF